MLEPLLGSTNAERVLLFLLARSEGYASEIARFFETDLDFVNTGFAKGAAIRAAMRKLGFHEENRYFCHPGSDLLEKCATRDAAWSHWFQGADATVGRSTM